MYRIKYIHNLKIYNNFAKKEYLSKLRRKYVKSKNEIIIILYNSFNELLTIYPDLIKSEYYLTNCVKIIRNKLNDSIGFIFALKNNHFF